MRNISEPCPALEVPVAIYTRVSTSNQVGGRFDSCESQAAICRDYLAKHAVAGWYEVACFTDAAYSGGTMKRPGIQALMRQIEAGVVKVVLIFKLERVLRSTDEWAPFRAFLQSHGCKLVSTTEDLSEETPSGRLKNNLLVSVAEYERLNTAEKVRAKMLEQAKRGFWNCGLIPFGYRYDRTAQLLEPEPTEAAIVERVFRRIAELIPPSAVATELNESGLRTREREFRGRDHQVRAIGGRLFRSDNLRAMIRNPIYAGRIRFRGQEFPARHQALVTADLWERANAMLSRTPQRQRNLLRSRDKHGHLLKGLAYCEQCGTALVPYCSSRKMEDGKPLRYYVCGRAQREEGAPVCTLRHLPAAVLEGSAIAFVAEMARQPAMLQAVVAGSRLQATKDRAPLRSKLTEIEQALEGTARKIARCVEAIANDGAEALGDELRAKAMELKAGRQDLLRQREEIRQDLQACEQLQVDDRRIRLALERFEEVFSCLTLVEQKRLLQLCLDRVDVRALERAAGSAQRRFRFRLKLPLGRLVEGMEQKLVIQSTRVPSVLARRAITLETEIVSERGGAVAIVEPFPRTVVPGENPLLPESSIQRHAIHRARAWGERRAKNPGLTLLRLAQEEGVSLATVSFHLDLLRLLPEIQRFLAKLRDRERIRFFGMMRLRKIGQLNAAAQRMAFAALQTAYSSHA